MYTMNNSAWKQHGETEIIYDNLNPVFTKPFRIEYNFEVYQKPKFKVYDIDSETKKLTNQEFIGYTEITLGSIIGEHGGKFSGKLLNCKNKQLKSIIEISAEELGENKEKITFQVRGINLDKKDFFGKSDPYLVFYRSAIESKDFVAVHKTEVIKNTLNPTWKEIVLPLQTLCNGEKLQSTKVECYDWDSNGSHDFIGKLETTINEIANKKLGSLILLMQKKSRKRNIKIITQKSTTLFQITFLEELKYVSMLLLILHYLIETHQIRGLQITEMVTSQINIWKHYKVLVKYVKIMILIN